jgi:hypothetical protein
MITQPDLFLDPKIQKRLSTLQSRPLEGKKVITEFLLAELGNQEGNPYRQTVIREILKTLEIKKKNIPLKNTILLFAVEQEIQGTYDFPKMVASLFAIKSLKHHLQECSHYLKRPINQQ